MRCGENQAALGANEQLELWGPMPKLTYLWALLSRALDLAVCCPEQELTHRTSLSSPALIFLPRLLGQMSYLYWAILPGNLDLGKIPSLFPGSCSVSPNLLTGCVAGSFCMCAHTCTCMSTPPPHSGSWILLAIHSSWSSSGLCMPRFSRLFLPGYPMGCGGCRECLLVAGPSLFLEGLGYQQPAARLEEGGWETCLGLWQVSAVLCFAPKILSDLSSFSRKQ